MSGALLTDLYQLTMLAAYQREGMAGQAVFELYARRLPPRRGYLLVAGLPSVLDYLETLAFSEAELEFLARDGRFDAPFIEALRRLRFTGEVHAVPEGTCLFAEEPWLRVTAPLPEAQLIESRLISLMHYQTLIASKAARIVAAAQGRPVIDFGFRRAHGAESAVLAARAAVIAGFAGTATVAAGQRFGIPLYGTMAHSFIEACPGEAAAFESFAAGSEAPVTLLIDTYDSERAARRVAALARRGVRVASVRIDSGDLDAVARRVRHLLDQGGCAGVKVLASGNLDEDAIAALVAAGAPIDAFAVGTRLTTSADEPTLDCVYKLQSYAGRARRKRSAGKATWPGAKQVYRTHDAKGVLTRDVIALADEPGTGQPLLVPVMRSGRRLAPEEPLAVVAARAAASLAALPPAALALAAPVPPLAEVSARIRALAAELDAAEAARAALGADDG